ncbi:leucine zipper transcription factor-like protein 1 [Orbicella faveolata]|uniref:leucine zipper transcription factor-like protein 1 n=2 Tax=Orbicella faveolata TaxID=48498 RepID=UPI0009E62A32|nr:leucine zipper transcription factor-like protein 1 [Orbicella faveolata]
MDIGLNQHHQQVVVNYLRFARYSRGQRLRGVDASFEELKDSRLVEDTYTLDEVTDMLDGLCAVVRGEVESELINAAHTNVLLLRQVFSQAEKWHLKLQADISELENRELISEIAKFEEREFSSGPTTSQSKLSKLSQVPKLEPLNEGGGAALLQVVSLEVNLFCYQHKGWGIACPTPPLSLYYTPVLFESPPLDLVFKVSVYIVQATITHTLLAQGTLVYSHFIFHIQSYGKEVADLEEQMAAAKLDLKMSKERGSTQAASLHEELTNCKHEILKLQHDLEEAEKDLAKKFNETTQYKNMKQMLTSKNDQIKDLRVRLRKYEPDS